MMQEIQGLCMFVKYDGCPVALYLKKRESNLGVKYLIHHLVFDFLNG